ncbi:hypothetical protein ABZ832_21640 [Streptantibioticus parmotrematis]|uniref:hypothetical protein n=1 Tax=Streptantibioticus parmotrematis TaxID=2873249 RepID=UPI0033EE0C13
MADHISENEIAALTRRYEDTRSDVETIKHDVLSLKVEVASLRRDLDGFRTEVRERFDAQEAKFDAQGAKIDAFLTEQRSVNATLVDLLTGLVGRKAEEA